MYRFKNSNQSFLNIILLHVLISSTVGFFVDKYTSEYGRFSATSVPLASSESSNNEIVSRSSVKQHPGVGWTDEKFASWISEELANAPGRNTYPTIFDQAIDAIIKWRQRFRGNPAVWKRIFKKERVLKELIESAPVLHSVQKFVSNYDESAGQTTEDGDNMITILDLCSGKGYLSMFLSELLPPEKVKKIVLVDKAWAMCNSEVLPHHMNWDHIYGQIPQEIRENQIPPIDDISYFTTWPIPLHTSKQDIKQSCNQRQMKKHFFNRTKGPILVLAVHLCGTLSLRAVDFFNNNENVKMFCLKPCCLPGMVHAQRDEIFTIGRHSFPALDVCSNGSFTKNNWSGPPRWHLEKKFDLWSDNLYKGVDVGAEEENSNENFQTGRKEKREIQIQVDGGFQNTYLLAERNPLTAGLWNGEI